MPSPATFNVPVETIPNIPLAIYEAWRAYCEHVSRGWRLPDLEAVAICLAAAAAHNSLGDPISLFIIGPPGSGKTSININTIWALPNTHIIGNLTPKSLYSSFRGCAAPGLLQQLPVDKRGHSNGIFLFKDFTTILSKREHDHKEIMGQIREIADGYYSSRAGVGADPVWKGKVTMFAACTHAIDRAWSVRVELGERFLTLRMLSLLEGPDWEAESLLLARSAQEQIGQEPQLVETMKDLARKFVSVAPAIPSNPPQLTPKQKSYIDTLGHFVCLTRQTVHREPTGTRKITDVDPRESPTRITKGLAAIARWHAALFRKGAVDSHDLTMAYRVGTNTIPPNRWRILSKLPTDGSEITTETLSTIVGMPSTTLEYHAAALLVLNLISVRLNEVSVNMYKLTPLSCKNLLKIQDLT